MWLMILLQVILICINAFFACAEIAVISINDTKLARMAESGDKRAVRLQKLTDQPSRFLATIQVAITLSGFLGSAFAAENFSDPIVKWLVGLGVKMPEAALDTLVVILITVILSYFTLVFGELVPKRIAMRKAEQLGLVMSGVISVISIIFKPIVSVLTASTNGVVRLLGINPNEEDEEVGEEEIKMMVDAGNEKGTIDTQEKEFIQNVFEFDDITAGDIITHRTELTLLYKEDSAEEWESTIYKSKFSRHLVCSETADNVIGILHVRRYLQLKDKSIENAMKEAVTPAYFVPENVKADVLFKNMKNTHNKLAVVLDEYGGLCGIVTINDLVEQLVGDLGDESPEENTEDFIEKVGECSWRAGGRTELEDLSEALGVEIYDEEYDTLNGYIFHNLGAVPKDGSRVKVETDRLIIQVTEVKDHQVKAANITVKKIEEDKEEDKEKNED